MVLVDTSIWIDHFRTPNGDLMDLLLKERVLLHPQIIGELACGNLRNRTVTIRLLDSLPKAIIASDHEASHLIEARRLYGLGIGFVDVHLLSACQLTGCQLWTKDRALLAVAEKLGVAFRATV